MQWVLNKDNFVISEKYLEYEVLEEWSLFQ